MELNHICFTVCNAGLGSSSTSELSHCILFYFIVKMATSVLVLLLGSISGIMLQIAKKECNLKKEREIV